MADAVDSRLNYRIKRIRFGDIGAAIVLQNVNGPCPLLALSNALLLRGVIDLHPDRSFADEQHLVQLLSEYAFQLNRGQLSVAEGATEEVAANTQANLADAMAVLRGPVMTRGMDVNCYFTKIDGVEFTAETGLFDLFRVRLLHGWLCDPVERDVYSVLSTRTFNQVQDLIISADASNVDNVRKPSEDVVYSTDESYSVENSHVSHGRLEDIPPPIGSLSGKVPLELQAGPATYVPWHDAVGASAPELSELVESESDALTSEDGVVAPAVPSGQHEEEVSVDALLPAIALATGSTCSAKAVEEKDAVGEKDAVAEKDAVGEKDPDQAAKSTELSVADEADNEPSKATASTADDGVALSALSIADATSKSSDPARDIIGSSASPEEATTVSTLDHGEDDGILVLGTVTAASESSGPMLDTISSSVPLEEASQLECRVDAGETREASKIGENLTVVSTNEESLSDAVVLDARGDDFAKTKDTSANQDATAPLTEQSATGLMAPNSPQFTVEESDSVIPPNDIAYNIVTTNGNTEDDTYLQAARAEEWLARNATQLTRYGLRQLKSGMHDGEISVLFRNNHYSTIVRRGDSIYTLVSDLGFLHEADIVFETLNLDGGEFVNGSLQSFAPHSAEPNLPNSGTPTSNAASSPAPMDDAALAKMLAQQEEEALARSRGQGSTQNSDARLARELQAQEDERARAAIVAPPQLPASASRRQDPRPNTSRPSPNARRPAGTAVPASSRRASSEQNPCTLQ